MSWDRQNAANGAPAKSLVAITKSDDTDLSDSGITAIWVGGVGNVAIIAKDDDDPIVLTAVPAGTLLRISPKKVMSTNTTATLLVGFK